MVEDTLKIFSDGNSLETIDFRDSGKLTDKSLSVIMK